MQRSFNLVKLFSTFQLIFSKLVRDMVNDVSPSSSQMINKWLGRKSSSHTCKVLVDHRPMIHSDCSPLF